MICAEELERDILERISTLVEKAIASGSGSDKRKALIAIYAAKQKARETWDRASRTEKDHLVRCFRTLCENRWNAKLRYEIALSEISELENMVITTSEVRANTMLNRLAIYALPASLAGDAVSGTLLLNKTGSFEGFSPYFTLGYILFISLGIGILLWAAKRKTGPGILRMMICSLRNADND